MSPLSEPRSWQAGRLNGDAHNYAISALSSAEPHGVLNAGAVETKVAEHPIIQRAHLRHGPTNAKGIDNRPHQPPPPGGADLAITHIFPHRISALPASSRSCPSVMSCLKALHVK
jgi:hypothetical protein